jgi:hypothetical protein
MASEDRKTEGGCETVTQDTLQRSEYDTVPIRQYIASLPSADPKWDNCDMCAEADDELVCLGAASSYCHLCAARIKGYDEGEIETYGVIIQAMLDVIYDHVSDSVPAAHLAAAAARGAERFAGQRRMQEEAE